MKVLIVVVAVCSIFCCNAQIVVVDDSVAFNNLEGYSPHSTSISECYGIRCPAGTVHCSTKSETSIDYTRWITIVACNNAYGNVLNSAMTSTALATPRPLYNNYENEGYYYSDGSNYYQKK